MFFTVFLLPPFIYLPYVCLVFSALFINDQSYCVQIKQGCLDSSWCPVCWILKAIELKHVSCFTIISAHISASSERCARWFPFLHLIPQDKGRRFSAPFRGCTSLQPRPFQRWEPFLLTLVWHHCYCLGLTAKLSQVFGTIIQRNRQNNLTATGREDLKSRWKNTGKYPKPVTCSTDVVVGVETAVWCISFCFSKTTYDIELFSGDFLRCLGSAVTGNHTLVSLSHLYQWENSLGGTDWA